MRHQPNVILVLIALLAVSCAPLPVISPAAASPTPSAALANPASVFCEQQGYRVEIRSDATGAQSGICRFPDGSQCDEWAYYRGECGPGSQLQPAPGLTPAPTSVALPFPATLTAEVPAATPAAAATTYTSTALGISFNYLPDQNGQTIKVLEQGDKIYVYPAGMEPTAGQWVQVFEKPADESLEDAIKRLIMPGHPTEDCEVVTLADPTGAGRHPASTVYAGIKVRRGPDEEDAAVLPRWRTCPQPYTVVGGIGYFQADTLHPEKFLFFSIGQYFILAGEELPWQATIRFD